MHIYSHLNYVKLVWGSMLSKNKLDKLFRVQKECMRSILNVGKTACPNPIFKRLKILKLTQMIHLIQIGRHIYYHHLINLGKKHKYNTHQKHLPNILPLTSFAFISSFMCKTISKFMSLSSKVKNQPIYQTLQQKQNQC